MVPTWVVVVGMDGREIRVCRQKEYVAGFPAAVNSPTDTDSLDPGSVTSIPELFRLLFGSLRTF